MKTIGVGRSRRPSLTWVLATLPLFFLMLGSDFASIPSAFAATTFAYNPVADAYTDSSAPTKNNGALAQLQVDTSPIARSYLRFNVSRLSGTVVKATLRLYALNAQPTGYAVYRIASNTWAETTINYQNAPLLSYVVGSSGPVKAIGWTSVDVTSYIKGNGLWSLALTTTGSSVIKFGSRESTNKPQLLIQVTPVNAPIQAPTSTRTSTPSKAIPRIATATKTLAKTPTRTPTRARNIAPNPTATRTPVIKPRGSAGLITTAAIVFNPVADAYVDSSSPTANKGTLTQVRVDGSPIVNGYLRFSVSGTSGSVLSATLMIYATSSQSVGYTAYQVSDNTWGETTITYGNAPAFGPAINSSGPVTLNTWTSVDVTSYVTTEGTFSFGLSTTSVTALALASRESANPPQLIIQLGAANTPTNTPTSTSTATATSTPTNTPVGGVPTDTPTPTPASAPTLTPTATPTSTATNTPTATPTSTPTSSGSDPVIVTAGDIACDPTNVNFNGGNGSSGSCRMLYTSNLISSINPAAVLLLGDNQYYCGGLAAFQQSYALSWGRFLGITHPSVGNHEYLTSGGTGCDASNAGAAGYFNYFGAAAGAPGQGYYSYDVGTWHLIALNSSCSSAGGCSASSPQGTWLQADLAAHHSTCTLAYWHIPLWSSGGRASRNMATITQILYDNNADLILTAHDHTYERFAPQNPQGQLDTTRGIRAFVVGTGGANHTSFTTIFPNSEVRNSNTFGLLQVTLHPSSYDWQFVPEAGKTFTDSGTTACH